MTISDTDRRRAVMGTLARASRDDLRAAFDEWLPALEVTMVRGPETGLVMLRGRVGGGGQRFNVGETTVTRATVSIVQPGVDSVVGHAYALGRDGEKVRLAAVFDALWCALASRERVERTVIAPLEAGLLDTENIRRSQTAATEVNFFTMVRGES